MNRLSSHQGSVHALLIAGLVIALVGVLGFVFWQNFVNKEPDSTSESLKTYTFPDTGSSFKYAPNWKIDYYPIDVEENHLTPSVVITTEDEGYNGNWLLIDVVGTNTPEEFFNYEDVVFSRKTPNDLSLVCSVTTTGVVGAAAGLYVIYGLSDSYDPTATEGTFSRSVKLDDGQIIMFGFTSTSIEVASKEAAKQYCESPNASTAEQFQMLDSFKP
jgi:hypothetical protein